VRRLAVLAIAFGALWFSPGAFAAGWCGGGETTTDRPAVLTGQQIHAVYVIPADGADTFPAVAGQMADDMASMSAWWTGQDPTRAPRFDLATFAGQTCADISFLRVPETGAVLASGAANGAFSFLSQELETAGFQNPYEKYLVYYAGPVPQSDVCGTGGLGDFTSGPDFAFVWLGACTDVPTDGIAAHELLHALGALPSGAPNACTPANDPVGATDLAHPCDSPTDILYPYSSGLPLSQLVLDFNHDDYYGHSGPWNDIQDSFWLHHLNTPEEPLAITFSGAGRVISDVPGVDCSTSCTTQWDQGWQLGLTTQGTSTTRFIGWSGGCAGEADCTLEMNSAKSVVAMFGPRRIAVRVSVTGKGRIACSPACSNSFNAGTDLTLHAVAATGWKFKSWSGVCKGTAAVCHPKTDFAIAAHATFAKLPVKKKPKKR
jgi:hypothetical protein